MHREAEELLRRDPRLWDEYVANGYKVPAELDRRVTRVGRFLRSSSLDELPQVINVVLGDMSLVGPRPVVPDEVENYGDDRITYLSVRPGLTGAWQINGRSTVNYPQRVALDTQYVRTWSLWLTCASSSAPRSPCWGPTAPTEPRRAGRGRCRAGADRRSGAGGGRRDLLVGQRGAHLGHEAFGHLLLALAPHHLAQLGLEVVGLGARQAPVEVPVDGGPPLGGQLAVEVAVKLVERIADSCWERGSRSDMGLVGDRRSEVALDCELVQLPWSAFLPDAVDS